MDRGFKVLLALKRTRLQVAKPLNIILRAKVRDELKKAGLLDQVDKRVWKKEWVVDLEPVGSGEAAFNYLAPYVFRVAISNNRILSLNDGKVAFEYKESATDEIKTSEVPAEVFIRRFLQHVLPKRFTKVRYYGLLSPSNRRLLNTARELLGAGRTNTAVNPLLGGEFTAEAFDCREGRRRIGRVSRVH